MEKDNEDTVRVERTVRRVRPAMFRFGIWLSCWAEVGTGIAGILSLGYWCPAWEMRVLVWCNRFKRNGRLTLD